MERIVGVDCATQDRKVGLACCRVEGKRLLVEEVMRGSDCESVPSRIVSWLEESASLLALDAPLGWPAPMGAALTEHRAGARLAEDANELFRRRTDRVVREKLGLVPLEVGANLIARTARAALELVGDVREKVENDLPLASRRETERPVAIEVYPAATLRAREVRHRGYKGTGDDAARREILDELSEEVEVEQGRDRCLENADCLDAVICGLAGLDYLTEHVVEPEDDDLVEKEGWIWFRPGPEA